MFPALQSSARNVRGNLSSRPASSLIHSGRRNQLSVAATAPTLILSILHLSSPEPFRFFSRHLEIHLPRRHRALTLRGLFLESRQSRRFPPRRPRFIPRAEQTLQADRFVLAAQHRECLAARAEEYARARVPIPTAETEGGCPHEAQKDAKPEAH